MRWIKFVLAALVLVLLFYVASNNVKRESETYTVQTQVAQPLDRVYSQFSNLQNFSQWNTFFTQNSDFHFRYFSPYEGQGSSMSYKSASDEDVFGEIYVRYALPNNALRYHVYSGGSSKPVEVDVKFKPLKNSTEVFWNIKVPAQPWWHSADTDFAPDNLESTINAGMRNLAANLANKVQKEQQRQNLKFDSLIVEESEGRLLLGVNVTTRNTKDLLFKNIVLNHNKTLNYITTDLGKKNDEYGEPVLITYADSFRDKEVSYYYGIPVSKRVGLTDNSFSFRTLNASRNYVIYYRGSYAGRVKAIQQILQQAKRDTLRTGDLQQTFIEEPAVESNVLLKLAVPVFR